MVQAEVCVKGQRQGPKNYKGEVGGGGGHCRKYLHDQIPLKSLKAEVSMIN